MNTVTEQYLSEVDGRCFREKDGIKIVICRRVNPDLSKQYCWVRIIENDFIRVSPVFNHVAQAIIYCDCGVPMLTEEEWKKVNMKDVLTDIPDAEKLDFLSSK